MAKANFVSLSALARHLDVARQYGNQLVQQGVLTATTAGQYDIDENRVQYIRHLRKQRATKSDNEAEYRRLKNQKLKIEIAEADHRLIDLVEVETFVDFLVSSFKNSLHGFGARLSRDPVERARIDTVCNAILSQLASDAMTKGNVVKRGGSLLDEPDDDAGNQATDDEEEDGDEASAAPH